MADYPVSGLSTLTTYSTADLAEIIDVSDTTYAPSGTNKKIAFQNLLNMAPFVASGSSHIGGAVPDPGATLGTIRFLREDATWTVIAPSVAIGNVLTDNGSGVNPTFQNPVTQSSLVSVMAASSYSLTSSIANVGVSVTLPTAGTYLLMASVRCAANISGSSGQAVSIIGKLYDQTAAALITNSEALFVTCFISGTQIVQTSTVAMPVVKYTVTGSAIIQLQAYASSTATTNNSTIQSDGNGRTVLAAIRIY
jgi:hypothetical protein